MQAVRLFVATNLFSFPPFSVILQATALNMTVASAPAVVFLLIMMSRCMNAQGKLSIQFFPSVSSSPRIRLHSFITHYSRSYCLHVIVSLVQVGLCA